MNLYTVSVPIGNLKDITERARETLELSDVILCEDSRITGSLLSKLGIADKKLISINEHAAETTIRDIMDDGYEHVSYASDAGTPNISDPGGKVVEIFRETYKIVPIPGPSALGAAIATCGFPMVPFTFYGFLPLKRGHKKKLLEIAEKEEAVILYESKHRIKKLLGNLPQDRLMFLGRELTKMHEELLWGTAPEILSQLSSTKGEFVIIIAPKNYV